MDAQIVAVCQRSGLTAVRRSDIERLVIALGPDISDLLTVRRPGRIALVRRLILGQRVALPYLAGTVNSAPRDENTAKCPFGAIADSST